MENSNANNQNQGDNGEHKLRNSIVDRIKHGDIKMHSRAYFALQAFFIILAIVLIFILAVFVASFLVFSLRASGQLLLPSFGLRGWKLFLLNFPWIILLVIVALVLLLETMVKHFSYRRPIVYMIGGLVLLVGVAGGVVALTSVHPLLLERAREHQLPVAGQLYRNFDEQQPEGIHRGTVVTLNPQGFVLQCPQEQYQVIPDQGVSLQEIEPGNQVFVLGQEQGNEIHAFGVRKIGQDPFYEEIFEFKPNQ